MNKKYIKLTLKISIYKKLNIIFLMKQKLI